VYVAANGNDQNSGLSPSSPKQHISAVLQAQPPLIRAGRGDWLLLRAGDTFHESIGYWTTSGASSKYPQRLGMYLESGQSPSTPRPIIDPPDSGGFGSPGFIASGSAKGPTRAASRSRGGRRLEGGLSAGTLIRVESQPWSDSAD
jgi:hypothetical protein